MKTIKIPELLAPVGGSEQLRAAVQNGADAVYMGGPAFNARIKAENFTRDAMKEAIGYAHERDVKVYVTVNTLLKDDELFRGFSYINFLCEAGADAVILQDMGLARLVRKYMPHMPVHLSTQATVYSAGGVDAASRMGFARVVPARELSLEEIKDLCGRGCEIEMFVHGAMCMCYSGQCHMSRLIGGVNGRSGNRGLCAQPCRLPYEDENGRRGYFLSPKDMCLLGSLDRICEAGVDSLKIEGRMKSPEYVATVTGIYRKYLDMCGEGRFLSPERDDMRKLMQVFNRGGFTEGYIYENPGAGLLSGKSPKNSGLYAGRVRSVRKGKAGGLLVDIKAEEPISTGDGVEIINGKTGNICGNVISYLKPVEGGLLRIGDIKGDVSAGDRVYKVTDRALIREAEASCKDDFKRKVTVNMRFTGKKGCPPVLVMEEAKEAGTFVRVSITGKLPVEKAIRKAWDRERIEAQLRKLGGTVFECGNICVDIDEDGSMPVSAINDMRREAAARLCEMKRASEKTPLTEKELNAAAEAEGLGRDVIDGSDKGYSVYLYSRRAYDDLKADDLPKNKGNLRVFIPLEIYMKETENKSAPLFEAAEAGRLKIIPYILNVSRGRLDEYVEKNMEDIVRKTRSTGIALGNPGWIKAFRDRGIKVWGDYGLNIFNRQSEKAFEEAGVETAAYSHEAEWFSQGDIPLMISEHPIRPCRFRDRKGEGYVVMEWYEKDKYLLFKGNKSERDIRFSENRRIIYIR